MDYSFPDKIYSNLTIVDSIAKTKSILNGYVNKTVRVAYSGGRDSDDVMWLLKYCGYDVIGVFYDTGIEYSATHAHIDYMRSVGFNIETIKAVRPVPTSNRKYGHPFISKQVSDMLERLQRHNFDFKSDGNLPFDTLYRKYPKCKSALRWWTNTHFGHSNNISWNSGLKEFLIEYGLDFKVSGKCCDGAKKLPIKLYAKKLNVDLMILGIRKAEGGTRTKRYKNCYVEHSTSYNYGLYFPLFWWKKVDRDFFDGVLNIKHSDCYSTYGLERTGCFGCPFGLDFEKELRVIENYEPRLFNAAKNIFDESYSHTRKYREFRDKLKNV